MNGQRYLVLDSFRGLCAIFVVVFHMRALGSITEISFFKGSDLFVNFFFVLSGFVMSHAYLKRSDIAFTDYISSRFRRLYPLYIFMLIVFIGLECAKYIAYTKMGITLNAVPFTGKSAPVEVIPNLLMIQAWTEFTEHLSFNYPSWSISIEFYTYILFFVAIHFFKKYFSISCLAIPAILIVLHTITNGVITEYAANGVFCFFSGVITYSISKTKFISNKLIATIVEVSALVAIYYVVSSDIIIKWILSALLFSLTIFVYSKEAGAISSILKTTPFISIGKWSYSIYMTHAAILFCVISAFMVLQKITGKELTLMVNGDRTLNLGSAALNNILVALVICITIVVSSITYRFIEMKFNKKKGKQKTDCEIISE
ncbi:TPA: acyltransferase family protein [Enterobacter ludwigii]